MDVYHNLKKINSDIEISSDFIISYPGETDEDFLETLNLIDKIKFINSYSFIFSPRPGTVASKLELINKDISKERLKIMQKKLFDIQKFKNKSFENKIIDVLVENKLKDQNKFFGRNKYMSSVIFDGSQKNIGKIAKIKIENSNQNNLFGKILNSTKEKAA